MKPPHSWPRLLGRYFYDRRRILLTLPLMLAVFATVIYLYELPARAVAYGGLLSAAIGLAAACLDFLNYRHRHQQLQQALSGICYSEQNLPEPANLPEQDYQALLAALQNERKRLILAQQQAYTEMLDYYTLWTHQAKVPLAALDLLIQSENHDKQALQAELLRLEQYLEMALGYMRLESQSTDFLLRHYSLDNIIRRALRKYARLFILNNLVLDYQEPAAEVITDQKWLGFVIEQLFSNAIKYAPGGKLSIYLEDKDLVLEDNGCGINAADLPRIFERGFTGYNGREEARASGLGLYLCRRVLDQLGHQITITSRPGRGTKVKISFPQANNMLE